MLIAQDSCTVPQGLRNLLEEPTYSFSKSSASTLIARDNLRAAVRIAEGTEGAIVYISPNARIPQIGDARRNFRRFCYECPARLLGDAYQDTDDGEVYVAFRISESPESAKSAIEEALDALPEAVEAIRAYVHEHIDQARRDA